MGKKLELNKYNLIELRINMKVAIFTSTGFVSKILIHEAVAAGYQVKTLAKSIFTMQRIIHLDVNGK